MTTPITFNVEVDISTPKPTYTYQNSAGQDCDGSVTVTQRSTEIQYTLTTAGLIFVPPQISNDTGNNLSASISPDGLVLTIFDTDVTQEDATLILVVAEASNPGVHYPSPDPQIRNIPS